MDHEFRRTNNFEDLSTTQSEPTAPIYQPRAADRDRLAELQSILDRLSLEETSRADPNDDPIQPTNPPKNPDVQTVIQNGNGADRIEKFDGFLNRMDVRDWLFRFELLYEIHDLPDKKKVAKLLQNTDGEANTLLFRAIREGLDDGKQLTYEDLRNILEEGFTNDFESTHCFNQLMDLKWIPGQSLRSYWNHKLELIERADPNITVKTKKHLLISGLPDNLKRDVNTALLVKDTPVNINGLFDITEALFGIHIDSGFQIFNPKRTNTTINPKPINKNPNNFQREKVYYSQPQRAYYSQRGNDYSPQGTRYYQRGNQPQRSNYYQRGNVYLNQPQKPYNRSLPEARPITNNRQGGTQRFQTTAKQMDEQKQDGFEKPRNVKPRDDKPDVRRYPRTPDGKPICLICNKPGHTQYSCPEREKKPEN